MIVSWSQPSSVPEKKGVWRLACHGDLGTRGPGDRAARRLCKFQRAMGQLRGVILQLPFYYPEPSVRVSPPPPMSYLLIKGCYSLTPGHLVLFMSQGFAPASVSFLTYCPLCFPDASHNRNDPGQVPCWHAPLLKLPPTGEGVNGKIRNHAFVLTHLQEISH